MDKPLISLIGRDGNAFAILGAAKATAKKAGWSDAEIEKFMVEARRDDYDHLLRTVMKYFDVI